MSPVGIVSIAVGVFAVCTRAPLVVAPAATLRWWKTAFSTNGRVRLFGIGLLPLAATMIWAGSSEDSGLAGFLLLVGLGTVAMCALLLVPFPGAFRALADEIMPSDPSGSLIGWRLVGLAVVLASAVLIYLGVLAL